MGNEKEKVIFWSVREEYPSRKLKKDTEKLNTIKYEIKNLHFLVDLNLLISITYKKLLTVHYCYFTFLYLSCIL